MRFAALPVVAVFATAGGACDPALRTSDAAEPLAVRVSIDPGAQVPDAADAPDVDALLPSPRDGVLLFDLGPVAINSGGTNRTASMIPKGTSSRSSRYPNTGIASGIRSIGDSA